MAGVGVEKSHSGRINDDEMTLERLDSVDRNDRHSTRRHSAPGLDSVVNLEAMGLDRSRLPISGGGQDHRSAYAANRIHFTNEHPSFQ